MSDLVISDPAKSKGIAVHIGIREHSHILMTICGLLGCLWIVFGLDQMQWKKSGAVCVCVTHCHIKEPLKIRLWRHGNKELQIIIIIMKEGKAKIAVCKENSRDVLECLLFQNSTVPSSVFSAVVYDGWCDSESSINSGGKAADTIKIADFYWSSPLNGSFPVLFSCLHSVHAHLSRSKRFLSGWAKDTFCCLCHIDSFSHSFSAFSVDTLYQMYLQKIFPILEQLSISHYLIVYAVKSGRTKCM